MNSSTRLEDDISRARYDRILFAAERCEAEVAVTKHDSGVSKQRRRMLELGAMGMLEAELEILSMGESNIQELGCSERELESFKSSLMCLMDRHYDNLGEQRASKKRDGYACSLIGVSCFRERQYCP